MNGVLKTVAVVLASLSLMGGSCDRLARKHPITLESAVFDFHAAIRSGKIDEASSFMAPQWREGFLKSWRRAKMVGTVHELDVISIQRDEAAEFAHVEASMRYLINNDLVERSFNMFELWKGEGKAWYIDGLVEGPPEFHEPDAQQWAPPAGENTPQ